MTSHSAYHVGGFFSLQFSRDVNQCRWVGDVRDTLPNCMPGVVYLPLN